LFGDKYQDRAALLFCLYSIESLVVVGIVTGVGSGSSDYCDFTICTVPYCLILMDALKELAVDNRRGEIEVNEND
jgi:hypothetical protein